MQQPTSTTTTSLQKNPWPDPWSSPEEVVHDNEPSHNNESKDWDFLQASSGRSHEHSLFSPSPHQQQQQQQRYLNNRRSSLPLQQSPFTESHHLFAQPQQLIQQPSIESQPPPKIAPFAPSHIHSHHPQQPSPGLYHMTAPPGQQQQQQHYQQQQQLDQHFPMHQQQVQQQQQQQHRRDFHSVKRAPPVDMIEIDSKVQIIVELPGLKRENLKIDIHDKSHFLTLKGRYERDEYGEDVNFLMNERTHGKFRRRIRLPQHADIDHVQANMKDGLLTIEMPSLRKNDNFMKKKRVINVEGLYHQQQQQQLDEPSTYSKARRFEWTDQDRSQVQTSADTTVHHHVK